MLMSAAEADSTQRQFNVVGSVAAISGVHQFKFGADYRRTFPIIGLREFEQNTLFDGVAQALTGVDARVNMFAAGGNDIFSVMTQIAQKTENQQHQQNERDNHPSSTTSALGRRR